MFSFLYDSFANLTKIKFLTSEQKQKKTRTIIKWNIYFSLKFIQLLITWFFSFVSSVIFNPHFNPSTNCEKKKFGEATPNKKSSIKIFNLILSFSLLLFYNAIMLRPLCNWGGIGILLLKY